MLLSATMTPTGIGARMAAIRARKKISQSRAAAMLEIGDRSYKNYETESRDLPLAVAIRLCERFEIELNWLVFGEASPDNPAARAIIGDTVAALMEEMKARSATLSPARAKRIAEHAYANSLTKQTTPAAEISAIFDLLEET